MTVSPCAYWLPLLHAHLPFVRHPEFNDPIEERWLHEAIVECYLPLLEVIRGWRRDNIPFRLALSLSPPLVAMLDDELLRGRARRYLESSCELAENEIFRTSPWPEQNSIARFYHERLTRLLRIYSEIDFDIAGAFAAEARAGGLELLTCSATHCFLPLLQAQPPLVNLQVKLGAHAFASRFGWSASGLWNAECGYFRNLDEEFAAAGLNFFFVEAHAIEHAAPRPRFGLAVPLRCPAGPVAFGRDPQTSCEVWDAKHGYPGDPAYREFHRDLGYDLEFDYIKPYIHESGLRVSTGLKYHAVTGAVGLGDKKWYEPEAARMRAEAHATDFIAKRIAQGREWVEMQPDSDRPQLIVSPFDAELFGHWWFEGPMWLDQVMRKMHGAESSLRPITPGEYVQMHGELQTAEPAFSSWGEGGYSGVWLSEDNRWIYPLLNRAGDDFLCCFTEHGQEKDPWVQRALCQFARELMLAQSSDWAFLITMGTAPHYAEQRTRDHVAACERLAKALLENNIDREWLERREKQYNLFPQLELKLAEKRTD